MRKNLFIWLALGLFPCWSEVLINGPTGRALAAPAPEAVGVGNESARGWAAWRQSLGESTSTNADRASKSPRVRADWLLERAGDLGVGLQKDISGIRLRSLYDLRARRELLAPNSPPIFNLKLRRLSTGKEVDLTSDQGWDQATWESQRKGFAVRWARPFLPGLGELSVRATAQRDTAQQAFRWGIQVDGPGPDWTVWRVSFPDVTLADLGTNAAVFIPRGPGEVQRGVWQRAFSYHGSYPGGWCSMQWLAAYQDSDSALLPSGLYYGLHDPWASTKFLYLGSDLTNHTVRMAVDYPAPNMGVAGNGFTLSGEVVWQLLRGDWFDAAQTYKNWARQHARWWPTLGPTGRTDSPQWFRDLSAWAVTGGAASECVAKVQHFQKFLGLPVGFHWYNWHQIPFDNDYPHYFPPKDGFREGVRTLQDSSVYVMPYINGRLWDTQDRGATDFEFSRLALPAASKDANGKPYLETYGSKETNGNPVRLAVMCPTTSLWQKTVCDTVLRLQNEIGTRAVYIDQVAAAPPTLCLDAAHHHPLGGGHWWNEGYWNLLAKLRRAMTPGHMITTECNGEPFIRWFDGYLTWHWQYDGQVPAFPAVYGGAIQMFGRAYRGGKTQDQALWMKAGQQLVFGEQIGWLDPDLLKPEKDAAFFRRVVHTRDQFKRYFAQGEMARPPKLEANLPKVKADWQWANEWWVTTDAVLTGAWRLPKEKRLLLLLVNVTDAPISTRLHFRPEHYSIRSAKLQASLHSDAGGDVAHDTWPPDFERTVVFAPLQVQAWELRW